MKNYLGFIMFLALSTAYAADRVAVANQTKEAYYALCKAQASGEAIKQAYAEANTAAARAGRAPVPGFRKPITTGIPTLSRSLFVNIPNVPGPVNEARKIGR